MVKPQGLHMTGTYCFSIATMIRERASVLFYAYIACLVWFKILEALTQEAEIVVVMFVLINNGKKEPFNFLSFTCIDPEQHQSTDTLFRNVS